MYPAVQQRDASSRCLVTICDQCTIRLYPVHYGDIIMSYTDKVLVFAREGICIKNDLLFDYFIDLNRSLKLVKSILFADDTTIYASGPHLVPLVNIVNDNLSML